MDNLNVDSLVGVLKNLDVRDLSTSSFVSKTWNTAANDESIWDCLVRSNPLPMVPRPSHQEDSTKKIASKQIYIASEAWRKGISCSNRFHAPGSDKSVAVRVFPDGSNVVMASAENGSCMIFDFNSLVSEFKVGENNTRKDPDEHFTCTAISNNCSAVAFGCPNGTVIVHQISDGRCIGRFHDSDVRFPLECVSLSNCGSVVIAGFYGGKLSIGRMKQAITSQNVQKAPQFDAVWNLRDRVSISCLATSVSYRPMSESPLWPHKSHPSSLTVGTSGGHVKVHDIETQTEVLSLVGSCSCPVSCLCMTEHSMGGPGLIYGSFQHGILGHGHYNAVYVWDVACKSRIALLYPGGKSLSHLGIWERGRIFTARGSSYVNLPITCIHADVYKVVLTAGCNVTLFDIRTWRVLYEMKLKSVDKCVNTMPDSGCSPDSNCLKHIEEPAPFGMHFASDKLALGLVGGHIGMIKFGSVEPTTTNKLVIEYSRSS